LDIFWISFRILKNTPEKGFRTQKNYNFFDSGPKKCNFLVPESKKCNFFDSGPKKFNFLAPESKKINFWGPKPPKKGFSGHSHRNSCVSGQETPFFGGRVFAGSEKWPKTPSGSRIFLAIFSIPREMVTFPQGFFQFLALPGGQK